MKLAKDVHRVYGLVVLPNGIRKLHEKLGFQVTGLLHQVATNSTSIMIGSYLRTSPREVAHSLIKDTADSQSM